MDMSVLQWYKAGGDRLMGFSDMFGDYFSNGSKAKKSKRTLDDAYWQNPEYIGAVNKRAKEESEEQVRRIEEVESHQYKTQSSEKRKLEGQVSRANIELQKRRAREQARQTKRPVVKQKPKVKPKGWFKENIGEFPGSVFDVPKGRDTKKKPGQARMPHTKPPGFADFSSIW